jgi:choline-sulfatase
MVRDGAYKLIVCETDPDQLYDLDRDPHELMNLAGDPAFGDVVARLRGELDRRLDLAAIGARVRASQRDRRSVARGLARGVLSPWDYSPGGESSMRYIHSRADLYALQRRARLEEPEVGAGPAEPPGAGPAEPPGADPTEPPGGGGAAGAAAG